MYFIIHVSYKWDSALHNPQKEIAFWGSGKSLHKSNLEYGCNCFWCWWFWLLCLKTDQWGRKVDMINPIKDKLQRKNQKWTKVAEDLGEEGEWRGQERWGGSLGSLRNNTLSFSWDRKRSFSSALWVELAATAQLPEVSWRSKDLGVSPLRTTAPLILARAAIFQHYLQIWYGLPWWLSGKEHACQCRRHRFNSWVGKVPWRRKWQPTPVFFLENPMDRGAWGATVHGVAESDAEWANEHSIGN